MPSSIHTTMRQPIFRLSMKVQEEISLCCPYRETHFVSTVEALLPLPSILQSEILQWLLPLAKVRTEPLTEVSSPLKQKPSATSQLPCNWMDDTPVKMTFPGVRAFSVTGAPSFPLQVILSATAS